jgi:hypothetical protein
MPSHTVKKGGHVGANNKSKMGFKDASTAPPGLLMRKIQYGCCFIATFLIKLRASLNIFGSAMSNGWLSSEMPNPAANACEPACDSS